MSFSIVLYQNNSEEIKVDKSLTVVKSMTGNLREECSIVQPTVMIEADSLPLANYAYISAFQRYYFITSITSVRQNLWQLSLKSDPLMSFSASIKANTCLLSRQENLYNLYLPDGELPQLAKTFTYTRKIGDTPFSSAGLFLAAQGKS